MLLIIWITTQIRPIVFPSDKLYFSFVQELTSSKFLGGCHHLGNKTTSAFIGIWKMTSILRFYRLCLVWDGIDGRFERWYIYNRMRTLLCNLPRPAQGPEWCITVFITVYTNHTLLMVLTPRYHQPSERLLIILISMSSLDTLQIFELKDQGISTSNLLHNSAWLCWICQN